MTDFVIAGWKHLPDESDVYSLKYSNTASCINQAWQKTTSLENKRCKTTQLSKNATARQLIRVFGIQFLQSSVIRLLNVVTKMVSVAWCYNAKVFATATLHCILAFANHHTKHDFICEQ